jgi:hypothetical protein
VQLSSGVAGARHTRGASSSACRAARSGSPAGQVGQWPAATTDIDRRGEGPDRRRCHGSPAAVRGGASPSAWRVVLSRYHDAGDMVVRLRRWVGRRCTWWSSPSSRGAGRGVAGADPRWGRRGHRHPDGADGLHGHGCPGADGAGDQAGADHGRGGRTAAAGKDLGGRRQTFTDSRIRNALRLIEGGEPATQSPATWACRGRPCTGASGDSGANGLSVPISDASRVGFTPRAVR